MPTRSQMFYVSQETVDELQRQDDRWGEQNNPDGTDAVFEADCDAFKAECDARMAAGELTFLDILTEEFLEVRCETDKEKLRVELIQVSAVALQWVLKLDREKENGTH